MTRPQKWEPQVGHQLQAVNYIREQLRSRRLGKFIQEEHDEEKWEEPEASDVEDRVWSEIREAGFQGKGVQTRELRRLWSRRQTNAKEVELLELGKAGGVYAKRKRTSGNMRRACIGGGHRSMVTVTTAAAHEAHRGEEGGEKNGGTEQVTRRAKPSALKPIFVEI